MDETTKRQAWVKPVVIISRIIFGAVFIFSGFVKAVDPVGSVHKFVDYFSAFHIGFLTPLAMFFAVGLAVFEFLLGVSVLLGSDRKFTAWLGFLFMCVMTPLTFYLAIANPVSDCGCFGDALVITNWETFFKNLLLLLCAFVLLKKNTEVKSVFNPEVQWLCAAYSIFYALSIAALGVIYEPVFDFRPYKSGTDISGAMANAGDKYESVLIYSKDGKEKEFTLDNYPADDSTWTFVDTRHRVVEKGTGSAISNFMVLDKEGDDMTESLLTDTSYVFLLLSPDLSEADTDDIDRINEIYDYSSEYNYKFYGLTSSSPREISDWRYNTGAEYPFYFMDRTVIETIARSNPAMLLIKNGVIVWKRSSELLPGEDQLTAPLYDIPLGKVREYAYKERLLYMIAIFIIPLLILFLTEKTVALIVRKVKNKRLKNVIQHLSRRDSQTSGDEAERNKKE